jgi:hypothetical protein
MLEKHTQRDGKTLLIAQMDDDHLNNMIQLVLRKIEEVQSLREPAQVDPYEQRLYGLKTITPEDAADAVRELIQKLYPYLAEAYLRGLEGPRIKLIEVLGRDKAIANIGGLYLPAPKHDYETDRILDLDDEFDPW